MSERRVLGAKKPLSFPTTKKLVEVSEDLGFNGLIFGQPGVGKTTLALTAQGSKYGGNVLLHDADRGKESIVDVEGAEYYTVESWDQLRSALDAAIALKGDSPYQTHVFDSLSSIYYEHIKPKVLKGEKKMEWPHYQQAQDLLTTFVRDCRNLAEYGVNTVFTGHVKEEKDDDIVNVRLSLPQSVRNEILLIVNHVGYLDRARNSEVRELHLTPPKRTQGPKFRQPRSGEQLPLLIKDPNLGQIFTSLRERVK